MKSINSTSPNLKASEAILQSENAVSISKMLQLFGAEVDAPDVLFYGDSVVERISHDDTDTRTLGQMTADALSDHLKLEYLSFSGYHIGVFYQLTRLLQLLPQKPAIVILPINMRSFSPQWDLNPKHRCLEHVCAIQDYLQQQSATVAPCPYNIAEKITWEQFLALRVTYPRTPFKSIRQFNEVVDLHRPPTPELQAYRHRQIFIYHYLHKLSPQHSKFKLLIETIQLLQQMNIKVFTYITPINYQAGLRCVGEKFEQVFQRNVRVVAQLFESDSSQFPLRWNFWKKPALVSYEGVVFKNYSTLFDSNYFFQLNNATEHLTAPGRLVISQNIAQEIKAMPGEV